MGVRKETVAGAAAGSIGTILGYPFDTIETRMSICNQTAMNSIRIIMKEQGIVGFFRGISAPLISFTILNSLNFSLYYHNCQLLGLQRSINREKHSLFHREQPILPQIEWKYGIAGAAIGPFASLISTPFELIKAKVQVGQGSCSTNTSFVSSSCSVHPPSLTHYNSFTVAASLIRKNGWIGLYQGHLVNTAKEITFLSTYFLIYENFKSYFSSFSLPSPSFSSSSSSQSGSLPDWFSSFWSRLSDPLQKKERNSLFPRFFSHYHLIGIPFAGGIAGSIACIIAFPFDCIKLKIQLLDLRSKDLFSRKSAFSFAKELFFSKSLFSLYSGAFPFVILPFITRAFFVGASRFSAYEYVLSRFE
jgi:hypothetical protein